MRKNNNVQVSVKKKKLFCQIAWKVSKHLLSVSVLNLIKDWLQIDGPPALGQGIAV